MALVSDRQASSKCMYVARSIESDRVLLLLLLPRRRHGSSRSQALPQPSAARLIMPWVYIRGKADPTAAVASPHRDAQPGGLVNRSLVCGLALVRFPPR